MKRPGRVPNSRGASPLSASWITLGDGFVTIEIVARPGASRRRIVRRDPLGLVIALNSAPDQGKANAELIDFLARILRVARGTIEIIRGQTARHKTVRIGPCETTAIASRLEALTRAQS